jgi:hypothetical protein
MPLSFPSSPIVGATSTQNGRQFQWTGSAWELVALSGSPDARWDLFLPSAPTGLTATGGNAQASLSWTAPTGVIAQAPITDYREQYSADNGATWTTFTAAASTATSATVTGLTNGAAYKFRVAAVNGVGVGAYTAASSSVTPNAASLTVSPASGTSDSGVSYSWSGSGTAGSPLETNDAAAPNGIQWGWSFGDLTYRAWQFTCGVSGTLTVEFGGQNDSEGSPEVPPFERYYRNGVASTTFAGSQTFFGTYGGRRTISVSSGDVIRLALSSRSTTFSSNELALRGKLRLWIS